MTTPPLRIGTRGSPLALAQTHETRALLAQAQRSPRGSFHNRRHPDHGRSDPGPRAGGGRRQGPVHQGDRRRDAARRNRPRGAFVQGSADALPDGHRRRRLSAARGRARRADLGEGGDLRGPAARRRRSAPRRCAGRRRCKRLRPDLKVGLLRGNVETRLGKAERGEIDATLLAYAGLKRLGLAASRHRAARHRRVPARRRAGRHRHHRARRTTRDADALAPILDAGDRRGARRRARLSRRARRLLPHADRRACAFRAQAAHLRWRSAAQRRRRIFLRARRGSRRRRRVDRLQRRS